MDSIIRQAAGREVPERRAAGQVDGLDGGVRAPRGELASANERMNALLRTAAGKGPQPIGRAPNGITLTVWTEVAGA